MFSRLSRKQPVSSARRQRRPSLEMLEGRQLMSLGAEMIGTVNTTTRNAQFASDTATNFSGQTVVVWTDTFSVIDHDIRAQRYDSSGGKVGSEIVISGSGLDESHPKVAIDGGGQFEVAWTQTQFNGDTNVVAQRFDANGVPRNNNSPPLQVANTPLREYDPSISVMPSGNFVVSYTTDFNSTDQDLSYKEFNSNGTQLFSKSVANTTASEAHSSIAISAFGTVDVAWEQAFSNTDHDIFLARFSSNGTFLGKNVISNSSLGDQTPSVSMDFVGDAVVAWEQNENIAAMRVSAAGVQGPQINIASSSAIEFVPSVVLQRGGGGFVVTYESLTSSVRAKVAEVSASNTVTTFDAGANPAQAVSIDASGNYFISSTGPELDIHARRGFLSS